MNKLVTRLEGLKYIEYILLTVILSAAFLVRLYKIDNPVADWHSFRQADTSSVTRFYVEQGVDLLNPRYHDISTTQSGLFNPEGYRFVELPIFSVIHATLVNSFGYFSLEVWGRLVSITALLISTYLLFLIGKRYLGSWGGLLTAAFFALLPFNIFFTRVILPEPLAVTLGLASLWFFINFIDKEKYIYIIASSFFLSLGILTKPYIAFYGVPMAFLLIGKDGLKKVLKDKRYYFAGLIVILPFIAWRAWIQQFPEGIPFWKWTFNGDGIRFRPAFWKWIFGERLTKLILGYWGLVPFAFGLINYEKNKKFIHLFLLGMFFYVSVIATANVRHDYYQTIAMPAIALTMASGTITMLKMKQFNKWTIRGVLIFSVVIMFITSASAIKENYKINNPVIIEAGVAAQQIIPKDALVIAPYNGDTAFLYQTNRSGWPVVDRPIEELIKKGAQYFVSVNLGHYQTVDFSERFLVLEKTPAYVIIDLTKPSNI